MKIKVALAANIVRIIVKLPVCTCNNTGITREIRPTPAPDATAAKNVSMNVSIELAGIFPSGVQIFPKW
jgi:hypothetical protein